HDLPLRITLWDGKAFDLGSDPRATIRVNGPAALRRLVNPSLATLGDAYVHGELDAEGDLSSLIDSAAHLVHLARHAGSQVSRLGQFFGGKRHSKKLDAQAIAYHYDVSNDFYKLWLDDAMVYSCAYFTADGNSLEQAQSDKIDHVLRKIRLQPGQRLLDIGCGWGALIMRAAAKYGARATGITLSENQYELARQRIADAGLEDRCEVLLRDYRDVQGTGTFDRITSIGMFEHVGLKNLPDYFTHVRDLLADDGVVMNHGITATDPDSNEVGFGAGSFIDRYVFPHGELPHISLALKEMSAAGLEAVDVENLRLHYAQTLHHWALRYENSEERIRALVGDTRYRIWRVYLAGCAYAFEHAWTAIHQVVAVKAGHTGESYPLPRTREYMYSPES
ncbi:MAG: cyclopropane-fatty-acyl-phospholipid synthase family protein, partial [Propionivibrio sp.]